MRIKSRPKAILIDLDDTIISAYGRAESIWDRVTAERVDDLEPHSPSIVAQAISQEARRFWDGPERLRHTYGDALNVERIIVNRAVARFANVNRIADLIADRYVTLCYDEMRVFSGAYEALTSLRSRGIRLGLLTNGPSKAQREKLSRFELVRHFDHIQIEGEHGFGKPEEKAYVHAMQALDVDVKDVWMVGDNLEWEVAVPQRMGIFSIWFDERGLGLPDNHPVKPDHIVYTLKDVLELYDSAKQSG